MLSEPKIGQLYRVVKRALRAGDCMWSIAMNGWIVAGEDIQDAEFTILEPTAPREPMSDEDMNRLGRVYYEKPTLSILGLIREVEKFHGIGREDGK